MTDQLLIKELLTATQAARLKKVSPRTVYLAVAAGRLPHQRILGRIGLSQTQVEAWTPREYRDRPGVKASGGRPQGMKMSKESRARLSRSQKERWASRKSTYQPLPPSS
jgi:hypothetical protein